MTKLDTAKKLYVTRYMAKASDLGLKVSDVSVSLDRTIRSIIDPTDTFDVEYAEPFAMVAEWIEDNTAGSIQWRGVNIDLKARTFVCFRDQADAALFKLSREVMS